MLTSPPSSAPRHANAYPHHPARASSPHRRARSLALVFSGAALGAVIAASGCVPTPFTFEETNGEGAGGSPTGQGTGGATSSASSGTGGAPQTCDIGFECVGEAPLNWGHALIHVLPAGSEAPSCSTGEEAAVFHAKPSMDPHTCSPCDCSNPTATCSAPHIQCWYGSSTCMAATSVQTQLTSSSCAADDTAPAAEDQTGSCKIIAGAVVVNQGTCMGSSTDVIGPAPWKEDVAACAAVVGGTCGAQSEGRCVQAASDGARVCIGRGGQDECPEGWPDRVEAFTSVSDDRSCSACGCEPVTCEGGSYTVGDEAMCDVAGALTVVVSSSACTPANLIFDGASASFKPSLAKVIQPDCTGGEPEGSVVPMEPVVFCCKP